MMLAFVMMSLKIIHTADWHLGQTFFGYDRDEEQEAFLSWLTNVLVDRQIDVLLIAGDVFDVANPSAASQRRFFRFLKECNRQNPHLQIVIIAGNHDSAARLEAPEPLLEELNTTIVGMIRRTDDGLIDFDRLIVPLYNAQGDKEALCLAVPYLRQGDYPSMKSEGEDSYVAGVSRMYNQIFEYALTKKNTDEAIVAMGHLHATGAELSDDDRSERIIAGGLESINADVFNKNIVYTALGHIHRAQSVGERTDVRYAGSPLPMSFTEKGYHHQVVEVTVQDGKLVSAESLLVPLMAPLQCIPIVPEEPEKVLSKLSELPEALENVDKSRWPYVEVQVLLTEPAPSFRHRVEEVLVNKAARLTAIVPFYLAKEEKAELALSSDDLQKINPLEMLRHAFACRYKGDLPQEIEGLFNEVMREVMS